MNADDRRAVLFALGAVILIGAILTILALLGMRLILPPLVPIGALCYNTFN